MKSTFCIQKSFIPLLCLLFFSGYLQAQNREFSQVQTRSVPMGKTYIYIYYGNAPMKEYSFLRKDANQQLLNILNEMGQEGWQMISIDQYGKNRDATIFMERKK